MWLAWNGTWRAADRTPAALCSLRSNSASASGARGATSLRKRASKASWACSGTRERKMSGNSTTSFTQALHCVNMTEAGRSDMRVGDGRTGASLDPC